MQNNKQYTFDSVSEKKKMTQTKLRGSNQDEYEIYLSCADNGEGIDFTTGKPLKTFDEWLNS